MPATKADLAATEKRLMDAINAVNNAVIGQLANQLKGPTDALESAVKAASQPK